MKEYTEEQIRTDLFSLDDAIRGFVIPEESTAPLSRIREYVLSTISKKENDNSPILTCYDCWACGGARQTFCNTCGGGGKISTYIYERFAARPRSKATKEDLEKVDDKENFSKTDGKTRKSLTFDSLRQANIARFPEFKDSNGRPAHESEDGSDWSPAQWLQAVVGELGEYANIRKKFERGDLELEEFKELAWKELADVACYLDILARRCLDTSEETHSTGVDLGKSVIDKFNLISIRVGSSVRLSVDGWYRKGEKNV